MAFLNTITGKLLEGTNIQIFEPYGMVIVSFILAAGVGALSGKQKPTLPAESKD